jgi:hypothetical protein
MHCECENAPSPDCASCSKPLFHQNGVQFNKRLYHSDCFRCSLCFRRFEPNQSPIDCRVANRLVCTTCRSKDLHNATKRETGSNRACVLCRESMSPARNRPPSPNRCGDTCRTHRPNRIPLPVNRNATPNASPAIPVSPNIARLMNKLEQTAAKSARRARSADHRHHSPAAPRNNPCNQCTCTHRRAHSCHNSPSPPRHHRRRPSPNANTHSVGRAGPNTSDNSFFATGVKSCHCVCCRCQRPVYENEKVWSLKRAWHRSCLRCVQCDANLSPGMHSVAPDGRPICNFPCSNRLYGSARYGLGCTERHS